MVPAPSFPVVPVADGAAFLPHAAATRPTTASRDTVLIALLISLLLGTTIVAAYEPQAGRLRTAESVPGGPYSRGSGLTGSSGSDSMPPTCP